jgi:Tc5 transposase DNA-binding domain
MSDQQVTTRESISLAIKDSIRSFYRKHEKMKINDMVMWAEEKYGIPFLPATMRTILFPKHKKPLLWTAPQFSLPERKRERPPNWPELELELAKWYASSTTPPKGQDVKEKAIDLWRELAPKHYIGQEQPSFGDSWRDKFKKRHGFKLGMVLVQDYLVENRAPSVIGEATNTNILWDVGDEKGGIRVTRSPSSEYKATHPKARSYQVWAACSVPKLARQSPFGHMIADSLQDVLADIGSFNNTVSLSQETTKRQSETSTWLIEPIGNQLQDSPFEATSSFWHPTMSPPLNLQRISSQFHVAIDDASRYNISMCVTNTKVPELTLSSRCSKSRRRTPRIFGNKIKRRRIQDATFPDLQFLPNLCDLHHNREIYEGISNLLRMASYGKQTISSEFVECIIKALVSAVNVPVSRQALCRYHKDVSNEIESNRIASMEALGLLQSAKTLQLQEWSELERDLLFDLFVRLPSQDPEAEEISGHESRRAIEDFRVEASSCAVSPRTKSTATHVKRRRKSSIFSKRSKYGRIDICSLTEFGIGLPETYDYTAEVVWTVPANELGSAQIRFFLSQNITRERSILMTPMISVRPIRPKDSKIFQIAAFGTAEALVDMILAGEASLADRDEEGRSLINVGVLKLLRAATDIVVVCNLPF